MYSALRLPSINFGSVKLRIFSNFRICLRFRLIFSYIGFVVVMNEFITVSDGMMII